MWFQDEARVGQQGTLSYVWAPIGSRPARVRDCRHESAYLFGAICPARAVGAAIVMPWVSSEAMTLHLAEISKQVGASAHAVLVCDGAGWHQPGVRLTVPENITLLRLPPYAPELNPMENVWEYMRGNQLSMTVWEQLHRNPRCLLRRLEQPDEGRQTHHIRHHPKLGTGPCLSGLVLP